jgi:RND family efflux transporter MFP subunit
MKRELSSVLMVGAAVAALAACEARVEGQVEPPATAVRVQPVAGIPSAPALRYSATIEADRVVNVAFQASGYVDGIAQRAGIDGSARPLQAGDWVEAGATLARVRDTDYRARVSQARGAVQEVEVAQTKARLDLERVRTLFAQDSATKPELDAALAVFDGSEAQLAAARAQLSLANTALGDTAIAAPFSGVVIARQIEVGVLVNPGAVGFVIARVAPVKAVVGVPDLHVGGLRVGDRLPVTSEAAPAVIFDGVISAIAPSANDQNRLFSVEISIANRDRQLRPGMVASVEMPAMPQLQPTVAGASVPLSAIVRSGEGGYGVFVVEGPGERAIARAREVQLGDVRGNNVVVTKGLNTGDTVVVSGPGLLADGHRIRIIP